MELIAAKIIIVHLYNITTVKTKDDGKNYHEFRSSRSKSSLTLTLAGSCIIINY